MNLTFSVWRIERLSTVIRPIEKEGAVISNLPI